MARGGFLCLVQRKEPGCVVGEQEQVRVSWLGWECWDLDDVKTVFDAIEEREEKKETS